MITLSVIAQDLTSADLLIIEDGNPIGEVNVGVEDNTLEVLEISSFKGPRTFGPVRVREVLRRLQELYPNIQRITGTRVSGIRESLTRPQQRVTRELPK